MQDDTAGNGTVRGETVPGDIARDHVVSGQWTRSGAARECSGSNGSTRRGADAGRDGSSRFPRVLEDLAPGDALALMTTASVGRVVFSLDALPAILPVQFRFDAESLVFRLVSEQRLDAALHDTVCAFEADSYDARDFTGWTVTVTGRVVRLTEDTARLARLLPVTWDSGLSHRFFRITPELVTGRLLREADTRGS